MPNSKTRKVTAHLPKNLLQNAQKITGMGITETLKIALSQLSRDRIYTGLRKMRGMIHFTINVDELREDKLSYSYFQRR